MNYRQLQYAILLSKTGNFSTVAQKLNISQPALSKQILSLEKELGVQLFDRSQTPIALTPAGEHFITEAQEIIYKEDQLFRSMQKFRSGDAGRIDIGITPFRSSYIMPGVIKKVQKRFPDIKIKLYEAGSDVVRNEAAEGKFDFAIINMPIDDTVFDFIPIEADTPSLIVPGCIIDKFPQLKGKTEIDFALCEKLPFIVVGASQEMRLLFDKLCSANNFHPVIAAEVVNLTTAWQMAISGVGATVLPMQFANHEMTNENVSIIKIKDKTILRRPAVITKKGQYLSEAAKYAIKILTN